MEGESEWDTTKTLNLIWPAEIRFHEVQDNAGYPSYLICRPMHSVELPCGIFFKKECIHPNRLVSYYYAK